MKGEKVMEKEINEMIQDAIEQKNWRIAAYTINVLKSQPMICWSWGIDPDSEKVIGNGIEFHVDAFRHKGTVQVTLNEALDLFEIRLIADEGGTETLIEEVYAEDLVDTIDHNVELTEDYGHDVENSCKGI